MKRKKQLAAGNYHSEVIIDLIYQTIQDFRVKYQESSIGFENIAYLQSTENKCKIVYLAPFSTDFNNLDLKIYVRIRSIQVISLRK